MFDRFRMFDLIADLSKPTEPAREFAGVGKSAVVLTLLRAQQGHQRAMLSNAVRATAQAKNDNVSSATTPLTRAYQPIISAARSAIA